MTSSGDSVRRESGTADLDTDLCRGGSFSTPFALHAGDAHGVLKGTRLDEVANLSIRTLLRAGRADDPQRGR